MTPRITVIGVGGAGGNAVNNMIKSNLEGVEFLVCNTDSQALTLSHADRRIQLGAASTQGLGAGSKPEVGRAAAEEALDEILDHLEGSNMVFVTAGMGGGTGTGAAPVIAEAARNQGILTVGVVTKPFHFEGTHRMRLAEQGIEELQQFVDTLIIIPNQNLFRLANEKTTFADAFKMADDVLHAGVRGVTDLMVMPGLVNLDFSDIRTVMAEMGKAMMGTGEAEGDRRAVEAAESAISNPLLDDVSMKGARGVLINITGGMDLTLFEVDEAANRIRNEVDPDALILFGANFDENLDGKMRVTVVATGIAAEGEEVLPLPSASSLSSLSGRPARPRPVLETRAIAASIESEQPSQSVETTDEAEGDFAGDGADQEPLELTQPAPELKAEPAPRQTVAREEPAPRPAIPTMRPAATRTEQAYMAPKPVEAPTRRPAVAQRPDPFRAADMVNGSGTEPAKVKAQDRARPSLFGLVTGMARRGDESAAKPTTEPRRIEDFDPSLGAEEQPRERAAMPEPRRIVSPQPAKPQVAEASAAPAAAQATKAQQPRLGRLDAEDRVRPAQAEEDLLDIPAFLRRQAN